LSEEQTPQVIVFSGRVSEEEEQKDRLLCAQARRSPSRPVELSFSRSPGCIVENMRVASVRAARRKLVKLFRKPNSRFYWYDFTVRGHRYRRSTQETKLARAAKAASVKLGSVIEGTDPFPSKPSVLSDFAERFDTWVEDGRLEEKTKKFYRNGWRLLKATPLRVCESTKSREISLSN
jgi:hypothetical protein